MAVTELFAGVPVADHRPALPWYERRWGELPDFFPEEGEAVWRTTGHAWIYIVGDADRADKALITILVVIHDPDGNRITFGQPPS
jgi:hypothetical protein